MLKNIDKQEARTHNISYSSSAAAVVFGVYLYGQSRTSVNFQAPADVTQ